jgi:hypothetical protein
MSEPAMLVMPEVWGELDRAIQRREPRALELAFALALTLPAEANADSPDSSQVLTGSPPEISVQVRLVIEDAVKKYDALTRGEWAVVDVNNLNALAFERMWQDERVLIVYNMSGTSQPIKFSSYGGRAGWDILNRVEFTFPARAQLEAYEFLWLLPE